MSLLVKTTRLQLGNLYLFIMVMPVMTIVIRTLLVSVIVCHRWMVFGIMKIPFTNNAGEKALIEIEKVKHKKINKKG